MKHKKIVPKELTLKEKKLAIQDHDNNGLSERAVAEKYGVSKSQIHRALKNRENILRQPDKLGKRRRVNRKCCFFVRTFFAELQCIVCDLCFCVSADSQFEI